MVKPTPKYAPCSQSLADGDLVTLMHSNLFHQHYFSGKPDVDVIYDRRTGDRRQSHPAASPGERRSQPNGDAELTAFGSAVVRID